MMSYRTYNAGMHERYLEHNETSTIHKMKETYWTTKQAVIKKLGKKEDVHVVASDHELDVKLEIFKAVQKSSMDLLRVIERYQERLCVIAQEENAMGRYLKSQAGTDKTRAGKMMAAVGKSQSFAAQQRLALRVPLIRLYQEVETFRYRAISDTLMTINRMETARTEYRGALLWMKNVSEELDPDTYKQLEKFRKVQAQVRKTKVRFDRLKLDVMQKVDLLAASRCNMFSHVLANYQTALLQFWQKTSRTMTAVSESFRGYQYYEFNMLKELVEPSKKLAEETGKVSDTDIASNDDFDPEKLFEQPSGNVSKSLDDADEDNSSTVAVRAEEDSDDELISIETGDEVASNLRPPVNVVQHNRLIQFDEDFDEKLLNDPDLSMPISKHRSVGKKKESAETDDGDRKTGDLERDELLRLSELGISEESPEQECKSDDASDLNALIEILNAGDDGDEENFSKEWQDVFGKSTEVGTQATADFMPSSLLDHDAPSKGVPLKPISSDVPPVAPSNPPLSTETPAKSTKPARATTKKSQRSDMSAWFNLFADLDPLSNPDAVGKQSSDVSDQA